jgi:hypothetical protein
MQPVDLITRHEKTGTFSVSDVAEIRTNGQLRSDLCQYFYKYKNRPFAVAMLNTFIDLRKDISNEIQMEDLMLCGYILGLHEEIEDCLLIWKAKNVDFDTYCGFDIQLMVFGGVEETIGYLKNSASGDASQALEMIQTCYDGGDFDDIDEYFDREKLPWWV